MYDVLVAAQSQTLIENLRQMHIWGELTGFRIRDIVTEDEQLLDVLRENHDHLVLLQECGSGQTTSLIRTIKKENLTRAVAIISETPEFRAVRKAFLAGADDYYVLPFEVSQFIALFSKIENAEHGQLAAEIYHEEELIALFENVDGSIKERLEEMFYRIIAEYRDSDAAIAYLQRVTRSVVSTLFEEHPWLGNYYDPEDFTEGRYEFPGDDQEIRGRLDRLYSLFMAFAELYPAHGEQMDPILHYILCHPEGDLRQKSLAEELHINRSYLSTVFSAQIGESMVDYVGTVRMARAAYLLRHTDRKVMDIAMSLDYHDMGYFLKRFRARYGMTPSQYRIPETYEFQI